MGWVQGQGQRESSLPGLHEMVRGLGGRNAPKSMGAGRAKSPCEWSTGDTVEWLWNGVDPKSQGRGDATGGRSGPLAKMVLYYNTHLARARTKRACRPANGEDPQLQSRALRRRRNRRKPERNRQAADVSRRNTTDGRGCRLHQLPLDLVVLPKSRKRTEMHFSSVEQSHLSSGALIP